MRVKQCDYLIIGSGAGGATVAEYLSSQGHSVHIVEEGGNYSGKNHLLSATESMTKMWRGAGLTPALGSPNITYAEGRCLGGGTEINSGIMQRIPSLVRDEWAKAEPQNKNFYTDVIDEYYDDIEKKLSAACMPALPLNQHSELLRQTAQLQGWKVERLPRAVKGCRCNQPLCNCGGRQSMTNTLLKTARERGRLSIDCQSRAIKLVLKRNRISEVILEKRDSNSSVTREKIKPKHLYLCAGAIHTPHILMRSGIKFNGLGRFQLHPTLKLLVEFDEQIDAAEHPLPDYAITEFMPDLRFGGSVATPEVLGMSLAENWSDRSYLQSRLDRLASYYVMVRPSAWGKIRSIPLFADPLVTYSSAYRDLENIASGTKLLTGALFEKGARRVHPSFKNHPGWNPCSNGWKNIGVKFLQRRANLMSIHLFSSCSTQSNPSYFLGNGKIKGIDNLVIADSSCLPSAPGINPQATIMAVAKYNAVNYQSNLR